MKVDANADRIRTKNNISPNLERGMGGGGGDIIVLLGLRLRVSIKKLIFLFLNHNIKQDKFDKFISPDEGLFERSM